MDDAFLVGVLDRVADVKELFQPVADGKLLFVTEVRNRNSFYELHDEIGSSQAQRAGEMR